MRFVIIQTEDSKRHVDKLEIGIHMLDGAQLCTFVSVEEPSTSKFWRIEALAPKVSSFACHIYEHWYAIHQLIRKYSGIRFRVMTMPVKGEVAVQAILDLQNPKFVIRNLEQVQLIGANHQVTEIEFQGNEDFVIKAFPYTISTISGNSRTIQYCAELVKVHELPFDLPLWMKNCYARITYREYEGANPSARNAISEIGCIMYSDALPLAVKWNAEGSILKTCSQIGSSTLSGLLRTNKYVLEPRELCEVFDRTNYFIPDVRIDENGLEYILVTKLKSITLHINMTTHDITLKYENVQVVGKYQQKTIFDYFTLTYGDVQFRFT